MISYFVARVSVSQITSYYPLDAYKLAAWISENFGQELQILPKRVVEWTAGELNAILENNLVPSHGGKRAASDIRLN
jgi:hypothetical protein